MPRAIDLENIIRYYNALLSKHREDARAVGWRNAESQDAKFSELIGVFAHETQPFTVYDVGCGLGNLYGFLKQHNRLARYSGCDINPAMIARARKSNPSLKVECRDLLTSPSKRKYDYVVASGTFNLRMGTSKRAWRIYVRRMAGALFNAARRGIAIGFLSTCARAQQPGEYHENPSEILEYVQSHLSPLAEIRHSRSPGHFAVFAYRSLPFKRISKLRGPSLKSKSTIERRGMNGS